jgi:WD40 repeat protein
VFSPDGRTLALAGNSRDYRGVVMLLDPTTGMTRAALPLPTFGYGAAFLHGGSRLVTLQVTSISTLQGTISTTTGLQPGTPIGSFTLDLWDTATLRHVGEPVVVPDAQANNSTVGETEIASPDGTRILTGSNSGVASVWDFDLRRWEATACRLAGRNLTRSEWAQYLPGRWYRATCPHLPDGR